MSATLESQWLETVDFKKRVPDLLPLKLSRADHESKEVQKRWKAKKALMRAKARMGDIETLASEIRDAHKLGTRTIVIVNTVERARDLCRLLSKSNHRPILLHSRFRPEDRETQIDKAIAEEGSTIVSTQVIEAGVDISATTLFTEVAPWASLVQRFGRCNRSGREDDQAQVLWIDLPKGEKERTKVRAPYELNDLINAAERLSDLTDVGLKSLPPVPLTFQHTHVLRRKDLLDLFDTTADLAGNDIDIDRFIRDVEETDVRVFWRDYGETPNETDGKDAETAPHRKELCPAPVGEFQEFAVDARRKGKVWRWDFLEKRWEETGTARIVPGQVYLVHGDAGGYVADRGWDPQPPKSVKPVTIPDGTPVSDSNEDDRYSRMDTWQTIPEHTDKACYQLDDILRELPINTVDELRHAARRHDRGKAHEVFVKALPDGPPTHGDYWAKARGTWKRYERRHFRHGLASALAVLDPTNKAIPDDLRDLIAYLVAAHHGKVRLSMRSMPNEIRPAENRRFARGVWDDDVLPQTDLGGGIAAPEVRLSLEPMELGLCEQEPFKGQPSWAERMIRLRDSLGPFGLAYLEALLRAADWRASQPENRP